MRTLPFRSQTFFSRRHPDEAQDTATPRRRPGQQSLRHGYTHATRPPATPKTRRHPDDAATQTRPWSAIPMAQRRTRDTPSSNPHGTAPPTRHTRHARNAVPNGTELTTHPATTRSDALRRATTRDDGAGTQQTKRTRVQPPDPQTINGNPSLRIREKSTALRRCLYRKSTASWSLHVPLDDLNMLPSDIWIISHDSARPSTADDGTSSISSFCSRDVVLALYFWFDAMIVVSWRYLMIEALGTHGQGHIPHVTLRPFSVPRNFFGKDPWNLTLLTLICRVDSGDQVVSAWVALPSYAFGRSKNFVGSAWAAHRTSRHGLRKSLVIHVFLENIDAKTSVKQLASQMYTHRIKDKRGLWIMNHCVNQNKYWSWLSWERGFSRSPQMQLRLQTQGLGLQKPLQCAWSGSLNGSVSKISLGIPLMPSNDADLAKAKQSSRESERN